jgi:Protein of unknown function (DUF1236)
MRNTLLKSTAIAAALIVSSFAYAQAPMDQPKNEKAEKSAPAKQQDRGAQQEQRRGAAPEQKGPAQQAQQPRPEPNRAGNAIGQQKKPETTGQASQPAKSEQKSEQKAEERKQSEPKGAPTRGNAQGAKEPDKAKSTATPFQPQQQQKGATAPAQQQQQKGAATPAPQNQQPAAAQTPSKQQPAAAQSNAPSSNPAQQPSSSTARSGTTTATSANQLPPQKQVQISETLTRSRVAAPQRNLNVSINIGTAVPQRVRFYPLPREIWSIEPAYRGYDYFTTEEDIVIIEPRTRRVVNLIPRDASRARAQLGSTASMAQGPAGGGLQCQVMRRDPASGQLSEVRPATVGSSGSNAPLSVTVQMSSGQMSQPVALDAQAGQIVVATQGNGDCQITIEPQPR